MFKQCITTWDAHGDRVVFYLLGTVCEYKESNENADGAVQKPDVRMVLEDFSADQNGKSQDTANQGVKP